MKKIYIILTHTGTVLSKIIKRYTKDEFSHISLSFDENLSVMYSFGRKKPYNPLIGGMVNEHIDTGVFKRFKNTRAKVYSMEVTDEQYNKARELILQMYSVKDEYRFNMIGLMAVALHIRVRRKKCFYCAEFIKYVIETSEIDNTLPELIRPENFKNLHGLDEIYSGFLRDYRVQNVAVQGVYN